MTLDEQIDEILANLGERHIMVEHRLVHLGMPVQSGKNIETRKAKAELLELVLEVIGNAPIETRGITQDPTNEKYWTKATTVRQKLIDEQRQKAYELFGKEQ